MPSDVPVFAAPASWTADVGPVVDGSVRALLGDRGTRLVVDLGATEFLSSAGLTTLIRLGKRLADAGGALALARPGPTVVRLLRSVGLTTVLPAFERLDEASAFAATARRVGVRS